MHKGLDAVFGESRKNAVLDGLYGQMHEQIEAVNTGYGFDLDTTEGRRAATEEYLAECAEFCGHDWRKFDRENEEDVTRWLAEHNMALMRRKEGVRGVLEERGELSVRPAWWREFLQKVKMFFYGFKGFSNYRFTDREIETLLLRGYRKTRNARGAKAEGGDARFAALRREGAPNTAFKPGQLRDSRVPHEEGFMEKYKFSGKGLYADYEFLYGRHPEYFEDAEHVRAAVEFVLAQPEEAVDVEGNAAFVRRDEETGTPYRIEIEKTTRAKYNHIRSVHVLSEQQYEKAKVGATPANVASPVLQPSLNRVRQTDTNGDLTGRNGRTVSDFLRYDSTESGKVKHSPEGGARFSIIGEEGAGRGREAEARMSGLRIAREMEAAGKDAKTIKRATGWERGGDGKWRMEIPDLKIKREETLPDGTTYAKSEFSLKFHDGALGEYVDAPELFEAYPELRNIRLAVRPAEMSDTGFSYGYFDKSRNMIVVYSDVSHAEEVLVHEVQHAIQALEGFPGGGDGREMGAEYWKLAGEVEAYNAAKRRKMTAEEKRESLLEETADVAEEDKIYLTGAQGLEHSFTETTSGKRPYYQIPFSEGLARVVDPAQKDKREPVFVCTTPEIMRKIGFTALPIMMNARHLRLNYYTAEEFRENYGKLHKEDHAHGLHETLKILPKVLEHPLAILVNKTPNATPGSIVCITDVNVGGKKIVVPLLIETVSGADKHRIDSHLVLTVYDSDNWMDTFLKPALEEEKKKRVGIFYFDKEKAKRYSAGSKNPGGIPSGVVHTIHDEGSPVKGEFKKQTETLQFKEWFGKSKVVDEEGKPLVVYHGSTADFTEFSYKFANRNGQADGRGFYFTDNRSFAEGYQNKDGKLFEVYLSIQKPLNPDKLTITKAELRKILDAIDPSGDYMTNYAEDDRGYPGAAWRAKALNRTVNAIYDSSENNADILAELYGSFGGGEVLAEVRKVSGYDGFIKKDQNGNMIYIAFEPGQIKSATDNIGTYDRNNPDIRFSIIGEEGAGRGREAEARMSDLRIAREMEAAGKDAKTIKRATGWERGGDGKWRMEIPDLKIKREETLPDGTTYAKSEFSLKFHDGALGEYVDAPELFEAYPELRNIRLAIRPEEMSDTGFAYGYFDKSRNMIVVYSDVSHAEELLVHEVQHAIQAQEGFPGGGDGRTGAEYRKLAGEVEAYNAAKRRKMTAEEKRESLLEETADVAEEDKIYLTGAQGLEHSFPYADRYTLENAKASKEGYRVERVNENAGRDLTEAQGVVCEVNQVFNPEEAPEGQFIGWMAKKVKAYEKAHSLVGTYDTPALGKNVEVRKSTIRSISNHGGPDEKFNLYPAVPDMLHNAVLIQSEANIDENTQAIRSYSHILASKVRYGEKRFVAIMVIHESDKICYYDYSILLIDNGALQMPEEWRTGKKKAAENGSPATAGPSSHTAQVLKVAREALLSSGFDTKSEKNLRFSIEQYSDADWSDMVTYMKAKVGDLLTKSDGEYKKMLEDAGMECYSEADAHACAVEAMNANLDDAKTRRKEEMMNWIVENNTWIQRIAEVTGSPEFKIRPSYRFQGMDFTGAYISQAWRDCSGNPKAKNREKRLKEASGYHSDELAQMIADKYGGDAIEIENDLIEYFQHKKKKASKTERENGELGVYDEYYAFKKEERLFNRELDRQMQEQWESQEAVRVGDEIKSILEEKRVIGEELAETDFDLFASLYQQVTGERAPAHPSAEQLDALNAAIQEGGVTQAYIRGWEAGRDRMLAEKRKEFAEFTAKVMQEKAAMKEHYKERIAKEREKRREQVEKFETERANIRESNLERLEERARENARKLQLQREANLERQEEMVRDDADKLYLQRQAEEFAKKNVPAEQRGEFIRGIVDLAKYSYLPTKKYPNGQRKAKLQELFERMAARGEEVRKGKLVEETEKLFKQAGLRADATRKQRNVLSFDVQRVVDRCREYANLSAAETETLSSELAQQIDNTELTGNALADLEYEARLLDLFGNYRGKSASEIELARAELKTLVNTGRSELKQEIRERVQADGLARSDITAGLLNGENPLTPQQRRALEAKRKREKTKRVLAETNWKSNSLDSLLSYLELPSGGKVETVEELQRKLYRSNDSKMTRNRKHAEELEAKLNEFCGLDPAKTDTLSARKARAELIRKWRERPEKTGIIRGQPNEMTQYMKWVRVPADQAQAKLKEFQAQGREVEAAALEHLLNTERLRIKRGDVTSGDAVTDALVKEMRKMQESDQEKAYFIPELRLGANPVEEKLTQLEALYMRLMWGQKNVKYKMRFNGWTESSMKQIDAYLKPEVKEFGEWMVKQLERDRADIEAVYEKLYFSMFPHEENYFPSVYNPTRETIDGRMTTDLSQEGAGKQPMAYTPGAVKLRAFHLMEPKICDALNVFVNHRMQMDHFVTHGETSRELRSIFANRDVAQTIRDVYGGEYYDQLRKEISDFIHGGNTEVQNTQFAQMALNNFTRMKMLWNLVSAGKQVFGGISYFAFSGVPAKAMAAGIVDFWKHPAENAKRLLETEYFKNRRQGGMNREMKAIMDSTGLCAGNMQLFMRELDHAGFMLMRAGDAFPVLVYGHAVYKYHYEQLVKQGLAPHEADIRAKEEWALATERTQQSGAPHMLNSWQKGNFAQKALVSFLSNPTLLFQSYSRDIYSQKRFGHGGWSAAKKIAVAGICSVLMSAINQMIRNGDDWDEYSLSDAVFSVLNDITVGWVGVGTLMSGIYDALSYGRAKTIPVLDDAGRAVRSGYRIAGEMAEGDLNEENLRDAIALLQGLGLFWSPAAQVSALGREGRRWWQFFTGEKK